MVGILDAQINQGEPVCPAETRIPFRVETDVSVPLPRAAAVWLASTECR